MNNGYIAISYNGEKIGLKFGLPCVLKLTEKTQKGISNAERSAYLLYYGYLNNCMVKQTEPVHDLEFFADITDESIVNDEVNKILLDVLECFNASTVVKGLVGKKDETGEESKKKNLTATG